MRRWTMAAAALGLACASAPPIAPDRVSSVESEIRAAQEIGAENNPQGKLHLQQARDQLAAAKGLKDTPEFAVRRLDNAKAEAELANAITREGVAKSEADQAKARLAATQQGKPVSTGGAQ